MVATITTNNDRQNYTFRKNKTIILMHKQRLGTAEAE